MHGPSMQFLEFRVQKWLIKHKKSFKTNSECGPIMIRQPPLDDNIGDGNVARMIGFVIDSSGTGFGNIALFSIGRRMFVSKSPFKS